MVRLMLAMVFSCVSLTHAIAITEEQFDWVVAHVEKYGTLLPSEEWGENTYRLRGNLRRGNSGCEEPHPHALFDVLVRPDRYDRDKRQVELNFRGAISFDTPVGTVRVNDVEWMFSHARPGDDQLGTYRAPRLLIGGKQYTPVDLEKQFDNAICVFIFAEKHKLKLDEYWEGRAKEWGKIQR